MNKNKILISSISLLIGITSGFIASTVYENDEKVIANVNYLSENNVQFVVDFNGYMHYLIYQDENGKYIIFLGNKEYIESKDKEKAIFSNEIGKYILFQNEILYVLEPSDYTVTEDDKIIDNNDKNKEYFLTDDNGNSENLHLIINKNIPNGANNTDGTNTANSGNPNSSSSNNTNSNGGNTNGENSNHTNTTNGENPNETNSNSGNSNSINNNGENSTNGTSGNGTSGNGTSGNGGSGNGGSSNNGNSTNSENNVISNDKLTVKNKNIEKVNIYFINDSDYNRAYNLYNSFNLSSNKVNIQKAKEKVATDPFSDQTTVIDLALQAYNDNKTNANKTDSQKVNDANTITNQIFTQFNSAITKIVNNDNTYSMKLLSKEIEGIKKLTGNKLTEQDIYIYLVSNYRKSFTVNYTYTNGIIIHVFYNDKIKAYQFTNNESVLTIYNQIKGELK